MEQQELLQRALNEITELREQNKLMSARLDMFDKCMMLFYTPPVYMNSGMMSPDVVYEIKKALEPKGNVSKVESIED